MNGDIQIKELEKKVEALISSEPDLFLVELGMTPVNNIKVFIDGDQGISIDKLVHFNRTLYKQLEESGMFPNDDFSLEISSPGLEEPLKLFRQYRKNIGRYVEIIEKEGVKIEGKLLSASENEIVIEEGRFQGKNKPGKSKKKEPVVHTIPFENIKMTKVQIIF